MPRFNVAVQRLSPRDIAPQLRALESSRAETSAAILRELLGLPLTAEAREAVVRQVALWLEESPWNRRLVEAILEEAGDPAFADELRAEMASHPEITRGGWRSARDEPERGWGSEEGGSASLGIPSAEEDPTRAPSRGPAAPVSTSRETPRRSDRPDPPRSAYGLLQAPEMAAEGEEFELRVGLSSQPAPGVAGPPLRRPASSVGPYTLAVQIVAEGFRLRDGELWRQDVWVTAEKPYPVFTLHLTAERQDDEQRQREIRAIYTVDGQPLGFAYRVVTVVRNPELLAGEAARPQATGVNVAIPSAASAADLTVLIHRSEESETRLRWTFETPHPLVLPDEVAPTELGSRSDAFAKDLMNDVNVREGKAGLFALLRGKGRQIARAMPDEFWHLLGQVAARIEGPPSLLFLSQDPYVPWELAVVEPALDPATPPFLACQANVGRWVHPSRSNLPAQQRPTQPPPITVEVRDLSVVSGVYRFQPLVAAEAEAKQIAERYGAPAPVNATLEAILQVLETPADLFHFSMHGRFDPTGADNGLILVDGTSLDPDQISGSDLRRPAFVFLNACQVGQGDKVLGDYAGLAAAFLYAGAAAVVAPLWSIKDTVAKDIAIDFYRQTLENGAAPADVLRRVRSGFKTTAEAQSATALAYQFFGHPALKLHRS